jgi:hypothetical protein
MRKYEYTKPYSEARYDTQVKLGHRSEVESGPWTLKRKHTHTHTDQYTKMHSK